MNLDIHIRNGRSGRRGFSISMRIGSPLTEHANQNDRMILTVIFLVQVSMNFNTSLYSNAIPGISEEFGVSKQAARCGAMIFLVLYAFGCELVRCPHSASSTPQDTLKLDYADSPDIQWAPWSEELGRKPVLQLSLLLVNFWQLPVALAPNFASIMVGRALGGLSSAGGSVTLGMIADMWEADTQQYAVAFVVFSSVGGSILGPIVGGFSEAFLGWRVSDVFLYNLYKFLEMLGGRYSKVLARYLSSAQETCC